MGHSAMFKPRRDKTGQRAGDFPAMRRATRKQGDDAYSPKIKVSGGFTQTNYAYIERNKITRYVGRR